ncbi:Ribosomal protein S24 [Spironucleus salmonicida]|uniref:Ribosomal protein S24 n=1 Tax=Spironucleus salmonicida TaxID=348837 RepID=V6LIC7_9EUKA|nr:Ribosomal protein S24 [Spironucleus salmonicida]|eukprot:EST44068.1 Ribosomal protein S24 [Spironucleus salmonicida]
MSGSVVFSTPINNPILKRQQIMVKVFHTGKACPDSKALKAIVADKLKVKDISTIILKDTHTSFGGSFTKTHVNVYESADAAKKFEPKHRLVRSGLIEKKKPVSRKMLKNFKNKLATKRGQEKAKLQMTKK